MLIILFIVLLLFGAKRVPEMGRSLGKGMREFKEGVTNPFADDDEQPVKQLQAGEAPASRVDSTRQQTSG
jgi:sec-independent protein translocase protein TatA